MAISYTPGPSGVITADLIAAIQTENDDTNAVLQTQITANDADILATRTGLVHANDRPGDNVLMFSGTLSGEGINRTPLAAVSVVANDLGKVYSVTGAGYILARNPVAISQDVIEVLARVRRDVDPLDPSNHAVQLVAVWLDKNKAVISETALAENLSLLASDGLVELSARISALPAAQNVTAPPSGAVYATLGIRQYGEDGALSVETVRVKEVTDLHGLSQFDLSQVVADAEAATTAANNAVAALDQTTVDGWGDVPVTNLASVGSVIVRYGIAEHDGKGGVFAKDVTDTTSAHNPPEVLVSSDGSRFRPLQHDFEDVPAVLTSAAPSYPVGSILRARSEGYSYKVADPAATDHHVVTASGVKLYVQPQPGGLPLKAFGAVGDGVADDTAIIAAALTSLKTGETLDLCQSRYALFVGNDGNEVGDAAALSEIPRLFQKTNVTIQNGELIAANPGTAASKRNYPTTFSVDGCSDVTFRNVRFVSRGQDYGDTDASQPLADELRADYGQQNGGHAFLVVHSRDVVMHDCRFERCGSVGAFYSMSSDNIVLYDCYSTAESLGYAAFAIDAWAGPATDRGWTEHRVALHNCRSDNNGATYGSKGCVAAEDSDVIVEVNGGVFKDAWPNGASPFIGYAFNANVCTVIVNGAYVENCASIGLTDMTVDNTSTLIVNGVTARGLRTAMHIQRFKSFGTSRVTYIGCDVEIAGTVTWNDADAPSLVVPTVVANDKVTSPFFCDIIDCKTTGAHTFSLNTKACYGGIRVVGGHHTVTDRIFDSDGWGGSQPNSRRGYELSNVRFTVTSDTPDQAITAVETSLNVISNQDSNGVFTHQFIDWDRTVTFEAAGANFLRSILVNLSGASTLRERFVVSPRLINCYQFIPQAYDFGKSAEVIALLSLTGTSAKITLAFTTRPPASIGTIIDKNDDVRVIVSLDGAPREAGGKVEQDLFIKGNNYGGMIVGDIIPVYTQ